MLECPRDKWANPALLTTQLQILLCLCPEVLELYVYFYSFLFFFFDGGIIIPGWAVFKGRAIGFTSPLHNISEVALCNLTLLDEQMTNSTQMPTHSSHPPERNLPIRSRDTRVTLGTFTLYI